MNLFISVIKCVVSLMSLDLLSKPTVETTSMPDVPHTGWWAE